LEERETMSEFGFSAKQAQSLAGLLRPIVLQCAALRNLMLAKGLVSAEEIEREIDRLEKFGILKQLERDLGGQGPDAKAQS
jgi:hypothetical protein